MSQASSAMPLLGQLRDVAEACKMTAQACTLMNTLAEKLARGQDDAGMRAIVVEMLDQAIAKVSAKEVG